MRLYFFNIAFTFSKGSASVPGAITPICRPSSRARWFCAWLEEQKGRIRSEATKNRMGLVFEAVIYGIPKILATSNPPLIVFCDRLHIYAAQKQLFLLFCLI